MKRILAAILAVSIGLANTYCVSAKNLSDENLLQKFQEIGCIWEAKDYDLEKDITRGEFATLLAKMGNKSYVGGLDKTSDVHIQKADKETFFDDVTGTEEETEAIVGKVYEYDFYSAVQAAVADGIMRIYDDGSFAPEKAISLDEVCYGLVKLLGYSQIAEYNGGYPDGYRKVTSELDLLKGVNLSFSSFVSGREMLEILENCIECDIMIPKLKNGVWLFEEQKDTNILEEVFGVYNIKGRINANEYSSVLGDSKVGEGKVMVSDTLMNIGDSGADFLLGYEADVYYRDDDGEYTILWLEPERESEVFIYAEDLENYSERVLEYTDENGKLKKANISQQVMVIYNGVALPIYDDSDFLPETGDITLIDEDNNSKYDIVIISSYDNYVVESVDFEDGILYDSLGRSFKWNENAEIKILSENFTALSEADITQSCVLSVAVSKDGSLITFIVNTKNMSGKIEGVKEEDGVLIVSIDGKEYKFDGFYNDNKEKIIVGMEGTFFFDIDGKIAYFTAGNIGNWKVGYIIKKYIDEEDVFTLKMFDGELKEIKTEETIKVDGIKCEGAERINNMCMADKLFLYKLNAEGHITVIDYPSDGMPSEKESEYSLRAMNQITSKTWYRTSISSFNNKFMVSNNTKVFVLPENKLEYDKYLLTDKSYFQSRTYSGLKAFGIGDDCEYADFVIYDIASDPYEIVESGAYSVIAGISEGLDEDDEIVNILNYYDMSGKLNSTQISEEVDISVLGVGDVVQMSVVENEIKGINLSFDYSEKATGEGTDNQYIKSFYTYAHRKIGKTLYLGNGSGNVSDVYKLDVIPVVCPVYIFDMEKKMMKTGSVADIVDYERNKTEYTRFFLRLSSGVPNVIVVWEE